MTASSNICRLDRSQAKRHLPPSGRSARPVPMESSPEGVLDKSLEDAERNVKPGMLQVVHIIGAINENDITVVVVVPAYRPCLIVTERIATVLEALVPAVHLGAPHVERVALTEMGTVIGVRNAAIVAAAAVVSDGLCLLPGGLLRLCALWLRLALRRLCALRLLLLGALWLRLVLWLRLLGALRLRLLGALRLRRVLRRLCFLPASALFLLAFLCECRKGGCEKY